MKLNLNLCLRQLKIDLKYFTRMFNKAYSTSDALKVTPAIEIKHIEPYIKPSIDTDKYCIAVDPTCDSNLATLLIKSKAIDDKMKAIGEFYNTPCVITPRAVDKARLDIIQHMLLHRPICSCDPTVTIFNTPEIES